MRSVRILLIEDNEGDILLIKEAFEEANILNDTVSLRDGEKAIQYFNEHLANEKVWFPDLILLDLNLPKIDGHEVLKFVKSNAEFKQIPVIILTTSDSPKDISKAYANFVNCYIVKPIEVSDFLRLIAQIEKFWFQLVKLPSGFQR